VTAAARLRIGAGAIALLVAGCLVGPQALRSPPPDPVLGALQPPLATVTALALDDGTVVVAPSVEETRDGLVASGAGRRRLVDPAQVVATTRHRLLLGSDRFGRDVLRELLVGGRISLGVAALSLVLAVVIGGTVGVVAATGGRVVDTVLMRGVDAFLAFPLLFLMILAAAVLRPDPLLLVVLLGCTSWMGVARLVRGQVLSLRSRPFIAAARVSGSPPHRIALWHYAPNLAGPVSQDTALRMGDLVLAEATLSYLGLGVPPSVPTWGSMVAQGHRALPDGWWLAVFPGIAIALLVIGLALIGDSLQRLGEPGG
jgi:peptide/nickel transport system permease protein